MNKQPRHHHRGPVRKTAKSADAFVLATDIRPRPGFGFLDDQAMEHLQSRVFELLEHYGVVIIHPGAAQTLQKAGGQPGLDAGRIRLPRQLIEEALQNTPKEVSLHGKHPGRDIHLPRRDHGFIMRTGTGAHGYVEPYNGRYRNLDLSAVRDIAAVANQLDEVGFIAHPFVYGVPEITADIHGLAELIQRTDKHVWIQPYSKENVEYLLRLAAIAAGGETQLRQRPLASCITCSFSPLEFKYMDTEIIVQAGQYGLPLHACSLPSAGGTAPLSISGLVLMAAAEILAMVTITHVLAPGTAVIATPLMFTLDMRTGSAMQSCVESLQAASMAVQLMKHGFGLPTHTYGVGSDTPDVDVQSMTERALLAQSVVLSGVDILGGVGQLECATVFSPVQAVLDNEVGAMLRRFIRTPEISDEALNWQELSSIRAGGHFLDSAHTLKHCREQFSPQAFLRQDRDCYEASERRSALEQARSMALAAIKNAPPQGLLDATASQAITQLVTDADRHILAAAAHGNSTTEII